MRNFQKVADEIIKVIDEECDFDEGRIESILDQIDIVKRSNYYKFCRLKIFVNVFKIQKRSKNGRK